MLLTAVYCTSAVSNLPIGFTLAGYNLSGVKLEQLKSWDHIYTVVIISTGIFGMMLGALLTDKIIAYGRWKSALVANFLILFATVPMMFLSVASHVIGRLILGFGGGMFTVICSVYIAETVPADKVGPICSSINFGIVTGMLMTTLI